MIVLVNGASGYVGQEFVRRSPQSLRLVAVSRTPLNSGANLQWFSREKVLTKGIEAPGVVIHLEVKQHVFHADANSGMEILAANVDGTREWLDWCDRLGVQRFIYFSSIKAVTPKAKGATDETAAGPPKSLYGASKWAAEQLVQEWTEKRLGRRALIVRPAVVYGGNSKSNVSAMVQGIRSGRFFLVGANENIKSMISINNLIPALHFLRERMKEGCYTYNLVDRHSLSVRAIDAEIRQQLGKRGNSPSLPLPVARAAALFGEMVYGLTKQTFPINLSRLNGLLEESHFSCEKLIAAGFCHPETELCGVVDSIVR